MKEKQILRTVRPFIILCKRSAGFFVAKSSTSFVFSAGTGLRMIWPGGMKQSSIGIFAPDPTLYFAEQSQIL